MINPGLTVRNCCVLMERHQTLGEDVTTEILFEYNAAKNEIPCNQLRSASNGKEFTCGSTCENKGGPRDCRVEADDDQNVNLLTNSAIVSTGMI